MKRIAYLFFGLLILFFFFSKKEEEKIVMRKTPERSIATTKISGAPAPSATPVSKAFSNSKKFSTKKSTKKLYARVPQSVSEDFQRDPSYQITVGHVVIRNVKAIAKENYQSTMGEIIYQDGVFNFVRSTENKNLLPVALSPSTGKLHPISSVLHVKNATEAVRREVKGLGLTEYYYHPGAKLLSVKSTQAEVLGVYSDLKDRGFEVQLEVVRPHQQGI